MFDGISIVRPPPPPCHHHHHHQKAAADDKGGVVVAGSPPRWEPIENVGDVRFIAKLAVAEHNKEAKTDLQLDHVVRGERKLIYAYWIYYNLVLAAHNGNSSSSSSSSSSHNYYEVYIKVDVSLWDKRSPHVVDVKSFRQVSHDLMIN
ncbi:Proteinase inhibitor I25 [Macleaya cordata]|uniref:Proteinase inhibitor I25 n=1 Tax=Macleaya cordata TaxID=56857 RepID=A0A200QW58_MACCD|nr:Proteinase inhibitor I25 [Macleaya cordata]